ncbi:major facilitator superfamily domain-containing protein [Gigaspora rosea]|uniref:Major facilitator superfamily domain-containing protein n=1 Tax=Gigaspora rosea TaxID=44941 RepID=A0A397U768_9GLOM|nr:major facilitator superfamily domain-containing protein [Gigaspora rosea]
MREREKEQTLLRKIDSRIVPLMLLLYLLSFLDRVNIGNAKLANLERDIGLVGNEFNWSLSIFFIGYVVFEVPSNLILYKVRPSIWLPTIMIGWGITMSLMAFVKSYAALLVTRFLLGAFEAGLVPGLVYYVTIWYKRFEQSFRMGIILSGSTIAGAFSGLLAYAIVSLTNDDSPLKGWQLIFLIDGLVTVVAATFAYFYIADYPEKAKWLKKEERSMVVKRLKDDVGDTDYKKPRDHTFDKGYILECLKDWKVYMSMLMLLGADISIYSFAFFVPSIVNGFGFNEVISQLLVAPPFLLACISTLTISALSDRINSRGPLLMLSASIGIVGYMVILYTTNSNILIAKYIATCIIAIGIFPCTVILIVWLSNNLSPSLKCNIGVAMVISVGNLGGIIAAQIYRPEDYPHYVLGHVIVSGCLLAVVGLSAIQHGILRKLNTQKSIKIKTSGYDDVEDKKELDDRNPKFIYCL